MGRTFTSRDIIKVLERDGWKVLTIRGSHHNFKHPAKKGRVTVAYPKRDIAIRTVKSIADRAGLKLSDF